MTPGPGAMASTMHDHGRGYFESPAVTRFYAGREFLHDSESFILDRFAAGIRGKAILDLGVGGGRTAPFLAELGGSYVGVDYSARMIEICRRKYPGLDFRRGDATDMEAFAAASFDFVFFSSSGIDYVSRDGRLRVLAEIRRLLRRDGLFAFSSNNLLSRTYRPPHRPPRFERHRNPAKLVSVNLANAGAYLAGLFNSARIRGQVEKGEGWAIRPSPIGNFYTAMYYSTMRHQVDQLALAGFRVAAVVSYSTLVVDVDADRDDPWLYYVARRAEGMEDDAPAD